MRIKKKTFIQAEAELDQNSAASDVSNQSSFPSILNFEDDSTIAEVGLSTKLEVHKGVSVNSEGDSETDSDSSSEKVDRCEDINRKSSGNTYFCCRFIFIICLSVAINGSVFVFFHFVLIPPKYLTNAPTGSSMPSLSATSTVFPTFLPTGSPTDIPSSSPSLSLGPSQVPSALPTTFPSSVPTYLPTTVPSASPTTAPSSPPTTVVKFDGDEKSSEGMAHSFMIKMIDYPRLASIDPSQLFPQSDMNAHEKINQRFAILALWYSLSSNMIQPHNTDECSWTEIDCVDARVTEIHMARKNFTGTISTTIGLLKDIEILDLGENKIRGSIPEEVYTLTQMKGLFLHQNRLTGTLSNTIMNLYKMTRLYLGDNKLSGSLPQGIGSKGSGRKRKLRMLSLGGNELSGTLPENLRLDNLVYLDISHNNFHGSIPDKFFKGFDELKVLFMDHNEFTGTIPLGLVLAGSERLYSFYLNDNRLTGRLPYSLSWVANNTRLQTINVKNNYLMAPISQLVCEMSVFDYGDVVQLEADCAVCWCETFCDYCEEDDDAYDDVLYDDDFFGDDGVDDSLSPDLGSAGSDGNGENDDKSAIDSLGSADSDSNNENDDKSDIDSTSDNTWRRPTLFGFVSKLFGGF